MMALLFLKPFSLQLALILAFHHPDTNAFPTYISGLFKSSTVKVCMILPSDVCDHVYLQQTPEKALEVKGLSSARIWFSPFDYPSTSR